MVGLHMLGKHRWGTALCKQTRNDWFHFYTKRNAGMMLWYSRYCRPQTKDLQDIHFSLSLTSSGRLTHHLKPTRIKETDHVSNCKGHRPNIPNKTLVIFASKETKAVLDGTMYPQQRRSKRQKKKKKKRMHGAKHLCHLTLLLPSAKGRNHVHATQH